MPRFLLSDPYSHTSAALRSLMLELDRQWWEPLAGGGARLWRDTTSGPTAPVDVSAEAIAVAARALGGPAALRDG